LFFKFVVPYVQLYNFIHHQTMTAINEKKQTELMNIYATLTTSVQKTLLHNLYFLAKTSLLFFKILLGRSKLSRIQQ